MYPGFNRTVSNGGSILLWRQNLNRLREEHNLSIKAIADRSGIGYRVLLNFGNGVGSIATYQIRLLAQALGVNESEFYRKGK